MLPQGLHPTRTNTKAASHARQCLLPTLIKIRPLIICLQCKVRVLESFDDHISKSEADIVFSDNLIKKCQLLRKLTRFRDFELPVLHVWFISQAKSAGYEVSC